MFDNVDDDDAVVKCDNKSIEAYYYKSSNEHSISAPSSLLPKWKNYLRMGVVL